MGNLTALILRVALGGLMAGHGAQKLFGSFGGGVLTLLGFLNPAWSRRGHRVYGDGDDEGTAGNADANA